MQHLPHLTKCGSILGLQLCQLARVQPNQSVRFRHTRGPTQLDGALQPSAPAKSWETCAVTFLIRHRAIAKMRSVCVQSVTRCTLLAFLSLLLSSPATVHSSYQMPNSPTVAKGFTLFCTLDGYFVQLLYTSWRRQISTRLPSSWSGVWDPWSVEYLLLQNLQC